MVFFEEKKIAFIFPAKTGSTTARDFLSQSKSKVFVCEHADHHLTPEKAKAKYPIVNDFTFYAFCRNPIERFISALFMNIDFWQIRKLVSVASKNPNGGLYEFMEIYYERNSQYFEIYLKPQTQYFSNPEVKVLDFDNYKSELIRATEGLGLEDAILREKRKTDYEGEGANRSNIIKWIAPYIQKNWAQDCEFWVKSFNKPLIRDKN